MKIILCCLLLALLLPVGQSTTETMQPFRIIPIPKREHGYDRFESIALLTKNNLDEFLKESAQHAWNNRRDFNAALREANIDFSKEALVLLRHNEGSGSVKVEFKTPILEGKKLLVEIEGIPIPPGYGGTGDVASYCMAVVVSKAQVSQVEFHATKGGFKAKRLEPVVFSIR